MANISAFIDVVRDIIVVMPEFVAAKLGKEDISRRFNPQVKDRKPNEFPAIALVYDFNNRERWAPIDNTNFLIQIEMKDFDDTRILAEAIRDKFDQFMTSKPGIIVYKMWHNGGDPQPIYNEKHNSFFSILKFETRLG